MQLSKIGVRIMVRKDYGACFDFYTEKLGLVPVYGDRNGPYTMFGQKDDDQDCERIAIFSAMGMKEFKGYEHPAVQNPPSDTIVAVIPSENIDEDYRRMKEAGVEFLSEPQSMVDWGMRCTYFTDPEGNIFELNGEL
ncbi:MAG: VOC family protein [Chitinivibrionia bacterium]|nr:VOC family protein [Chitinivibrionia bacterium]